jgi:hypothetical protein
VTTGVAGSNAVAQAICDRARPVLGAVVVNMAILGDDLKTTTVAWSVDKGSRYDRALAAARKIMPGIEPVGMRVDAALNHFTSEVLFNGRTQLARFEDAARYSVHPMVIGLAAKTLGMRWSLSIPLVVGPKIVGSFSAHFSDRPSDDTQAKAAALATEAASELERTGAFR